MKYALAFLFCLILASRPLCNAQSLLPNKALEIKSETLIKWSEAYGKMYPDRSCNNITQIQTYISDGTQLHLECALHDKGDKPSLSRTITYNGRAMHMLFNPGAVIFVKEDGPIQIKNSSNGEALASQFVCFYAANPLLTFNQWKITSYKNETLLFELNQLLSSDALIEQLLKTARPEKLPDGQTVSTVTTKGYDVTNHDKLAIYKVYFNPESKRCIGWQCRTEDNTSLWEYRVTEWLEPEGETMIALPKTATLNWAYAEDGRHYVSMTDWQLSISSVALINSDPALFTIDYSLARAYYDFALGHQVGIRK